MLLANIKPKRIAAVLRGFLVTARLSCLGLWYYTVLANLQNGGPESRFARDGLRSKVNYFRAFYNFTFSRAEKRDQRLETPKYLNADASSFPH